MDDFDLFVFVEESVDEMLSDFIASEEVLEKLFIEGVPDDDDNNLDARYALKFCSDSAGVMDRSGLGIECFDVGKVSFQISS